MRRFQEDIGARALAEAKKPRKPRAKKPVAELFERHVDRSGGKNACHPFHGHVGGSNGYGRYKWNGKTTSAHKVAFMLEHGIDAIPDDMHVLHKRGCCKTCVNGRHLRLGYRAENVADAVAEGRMKRTRTKLSKRNVEAIVRNLRKGVKPTKLANKYGVSCQTIVSIRTGRTWSKVTGIGLTKEQRRKAFSVVRGGLEALGEVA